MNSNSSRMRHMISHHSVHLSNPRRRLMMALVTSLCLFIGMAANVALAQDAGEDLAETTLWTALQDRPAQSQRAGASSDTQAGSTEAEKPSHLAIVGGTVHTVTGPVLHNATILITDGKITDIGPRVTIPDSADVVDAAGYRVYPGIVSIRPGNVRGNEPAEDTSDVYSINTVMALAGGVTTVVASNSAAKVTFGTLDDMTIRRGLFESIRWTSNDPQGKRRLRESFDRLQAYIRDLEAYEERRRRDPSATAPDNRWIRGEFERNLRLLRGEAVALMDANTTHELLQICELANQYGLRIVVRGAREGWLVAPELARAGIACIVTPRTRSDRDQRYNRPNGSSIENAAILHQHGVPVAIVPSNTSIGFGGLAGRDLLHIAMEAAFGVRGGLSNAEAIRAITIQPARMMGIDHRVGSIEVGKDADLIITDGELLHYATHVRWAFVNGRLAYDKMQESLLDHIRPDDPDAQPAQDYWPRRLGEAW